MNELRNMLSGTIFREWRTKGDTVTAGDMADAILAEPRLSVTLAPKPESAGPSTFTPGGGR